MNASRYRLSAARAELFLPPAVICSGLIGWEIAAQAGWISDLFFPAPTLIVVTLVEMLGSGDFWISICMTLYRLIAGVAAGAGVGLVLGWLMGAERPVRVALDPIVAVLHPMPKLAIFPIFLIIFGIGETSRITLIALAAFFPMLLNTLAGVQQIDRAYWEVATNYGAGWKAMLLQVVVPGSLPMALTGLRLALNNALVVAIAIEMLSAHKGLGAHLWMAWQTLRTEELYATLILIGMLGLAFNGMVQTMTRRLLPWHVVFSNH